MSTHTVHPADSPLRVINPVFNEPATGAQADRESTVARAAAILHDAYEAVSRLPGWEPEEARGWREEAALVLGAPNPRDAALDEHLSSMRRVFEDAAADERLTDDERARWAERASKAADSLRSRRSVECRLEIV